MAADVIREEIRKGESVKLWCALGDVTDDVECYQKALDVAGNDDHSVPHKHWALFLYSRKKYAESIPHLEKSLATNCLQTELWFKLGYAAMELQDWVKCASAYKRFCALESESMEAWSNLGKAYAECGQNDLAIQAFREAVKCSFDSWIVWDNLMTLLARTKRFDEVVHCYHRVLDLNPKRLDLEMALKLGELAASDSKMIPQRKSVAQLFARLVLISDHPALWFGYAELMTVAGDGSLLNMDTVIKYYRRHSVHIHVTIHG